jgi:hypothetical protein
MLFIIMGFQWWIHIGSSMEQKDEEVWKQNVSVGDKLGLMLLKVYADEGLYVADSKWIVASNEH